MSRPAVAEVSAPFVLRLSAAHKNVLGLFKRAGSDASANDTGKALCDMGLLARESPEGYIEDVIIFDERHTQKDVAVTRAHRQAIRVLCGADGLALLEKTKRMTTSAWLMTGGDTSRVHEGAAGYLHILSRPV
jgi:hypothetical protein